MNNTTNNLEPDFIDPDQESAVWVGIIFGIIIFIGIPSNLLVILLTVTVENIRSVPSNLCLLSIAAADSMTLVSISSAVIYAITFDVSICKIFGVGLYIFVLPSV